VSRIEEPNSTNEKSRHRGRRRLFFQFFFRISRTRVRGRTPGARPNNIIQKQSVQYTITIYESRSKYVNVRKTVAFLIFILLLLLLGGLVGAGNVQTSNVSIQIYNIFIRRGLAQYIDKLKEISDFIDYKEFFREAKLTQEKGIRSHGPRYAYIS
jgi:hypothetical protein